MELKNETIRLNFDAACSLTHVEGFSAVKVPIAAKALTDVFKIRLRMPDRRMVDIGPQGSPDMRITQEKGRRRLTASWQLRGEWGNMTVCAEIVLPERSSLSYWTIDIKNETAGAIWQVDYPRISGLSDFTGRKGPGWLAVPLQVGEKIPNPVAFVNSNKAVVSDQAQDLFGLKGGLGEIAFSYPGMWTMQYLAYGHPDSGGLYFAAYDPQALYKEFGMYRDGTSRDQAVIALKQYPKDRTAIAKDYRSFYPVAIGVYQGEWWGASALYREWALKQIWCQKGPVRSSKTVPAWLKNADFWYWNFWATGRGAPVKLVPAIQYLKERLGCGKMGFHWYEYTGMMHDNLFTYPNMYPHDPDCMKALREGVKQLHAMGVYCIPYINARLWNTRTRSFEKYRGVEHIAVDEEGKPAHVWGTLGQTVCPTSKVFQDIIRKTTNDLVDDVGMDGAYLDQISSCFAVPCFNPKHSHAPGGHDHWVVGYRAMLKKVRRDMRRRNKDSLITSESTIECFLDLIDADLCYVYARTGTFTGNNEAFNIPMFHSVYHDYHVTYGSNLKLDLSAGDFRYSGALALVAGIQITMGGFFKDDESQAKFRPHLEFLDALVKAHQAARAWFNFGVWKPPVPIRCDLVEVAYRAGKSPKRNVPSVLSGCFELDGKLCMVMVNHTAQPRKVVFALSPRAYGLKGKAFELRSIYPESKSVTRLNSDGERRKMTVPPNQAQVLMLVPVK